MKKPSRNEAGASAVYGIGFVGALVYFIQHAQGIDGFILGVFKALIWPGIIVYKLLEFLKF